MKIFFILLVSSFFLFSCKNNPSSSSGTASGGDEGTVYLRTMYWAGSYGGSLEVTWYYLGDDGVIVRNARHGMNPVDVEKEKEDNEENTGTYKEKNKKLYIKWENGKRDTFDFNRKDPGKTGIDGGIVTIPARFEKDARIKGRFSYLAFNPTISNVETIVFKKNGTFQTTRSTSVNVKDVTSKQGEKSSGGKYRIEGNTLRLQFDNGEEQTANVAYWENDDGTLMLVINDKTFPQEND